MENPSDNANEIASKLSEKGLVSMLTSLRDVLSEELIQAFLLELEKRNFPPERLTKLKQQTESNRLTAPLSLGFFWKLIALFLPFIAIIFPNIIRSFGYHRKARELKTWCLYGLLTYTILVVLVELLSI